MHDTKLEGVPDVRAQKARASLICSTKFSLAYCSQWTKSAEIVLSIACQEKQYSGLKKQKVTKRCVDKLIVRLLPFYLLLL